VRRHAILLMAASASVLAGCAPRLGASDMPRPRPGLWRRVGVLNGTPSAGDACLSGAPVHIPLQATACQQIAWSSPSNGVFQIDARCGLPPGPGSQVRARYSGDFQSSYAVDGQNVLNVPGQPLIVNNYSNTYRYAGPCPPGRGADDLQ